MSLPLSQLSDRVLLAERVRSEEVGLLSDSNVLSDGFYRTGEERSRLYADALQIRGRLRQGGGWLGALISLVIGMRLVNLSRWPRREIYSPDRALCFSCGRCFRYCPRDALARKGNVEVSE